MSEQIPNVMCDEVEIIEDCFERTMHHWKDFWKEMGVELDISQIPKFSDMPGLRPLVIPKCEEGLTQKVFKKCEALFSCWKSHEGSLEDLENDRDPRSGSYVVWFNDDPAADNDLRELSADDHKEDALECITLLERLVMELDYFMRMKKHMDTKSVTLCSGSHYPDGNVPDAFFNELEGGIIDDDFEEFRTLLCDKGLKNPKLAPRALMGFLPGKDYRKRDELKTA